MRDIFWSSVLPQENRHPTPDIIRPCVLRKCDYSMPRPMSSDRVCCPRAMISCHNWRSMIVSTVQGRDGIAMVDIIWPCLLTMGDDGMARPTSFDRLCYLREMIYSTSDVVRPCVCCTIARMATMAEFIRPCVHSKGDDGMPRPMLFYRICYPRAVMSFHARRSTIICSVQAP